jgi:hypothetical protein
MRTIVHGSAHGRSSRRNRRSADEKSELKILREQKNGFHPERGNGRESDRGKVGKEGSPLEMGEKKTGWAVVFRIVSVLLRSFVKRSGRSCMLRFLFAVITTARGRRGIGIRGAFLG